MFMAKKLIAIRIDDETMQKLEWLVETTGWTQTDIVARLIDHAWVRPAAIGTELGTKKAFALARTMA
jgi:hypothetical protein